MTFEKPQPARIRGTCDSSDSLLVADEALALLQHRCGGVPGGRLAIPTVLELVRKARGYGMKLSRPVKVWDGQQAVSAWLDVQPKEDGACDLSFRHWSTSELQPDRDEDRRRLAIEAATADMHVLLDAAQAVILAEAFSDDLSPLAQWMNDQPGQHWCDYVAAPEGSDASKQNAGDMHWRLLDGITVRAEGSSRTFRAVLAPQGADGAAPEGFHLYLNSDEAIPEAIPELPVRDDNARLIGKDIAPVLRQPIARIIANAETIRTRMAGPLADEYSDYAADIAAAGQHLLDLVDDLSDLEVVESADFTTAPDQVDLADLARRAAGILGVRAREKGIHIDAPKQDETCPAIAEFRRVLQILLNLIGNAIRYAPEESQIWVRLECEGAEAHVIVADQGPGLSAEQQARVFEKFERLGRSGDGGTGLGLYISRRLAEAMGGSLSVESQPGQGARFTLSVPADSAALAPAAQPNHN